MNYPTFLFVSALTCLTAGSLQADEVVAPNASTIKEQALLTPAQIDELLAPIALYPDPLVAIILPAATFPTDVVMAARYLKDGGSTTNIEAQDWDDSVKALARYPDVVKWMDENLAWTKQLGAAFVLQPAAVLSGTQRLRTEAIAAGNLKTTPQQTVVVEREVVRIVPAQREVIYVPVYDPVYVYRPCPVGVVYPRSIISFSIGYPAGFWLSYDCNWGINTVVVVGRPYRTVVWNRYPTWHYPSHAIVYHQPWRPSPVCVQTVRHDFDRRTDYRVSRPTAYVNYQRPPDRDTPARNYTRTDDRDRRDNRPANIAPAERPASAPAPVVTMPSQSTDRPVTNRLRPGRAPVVTAEQVAEKSESPRRSDRSEYRTEIQSTSTAPASSPAGRTLGGRRQQPDVSSAQLTSPAPVVTRSAPRTIVTTDTQQPVTSPRPGRFNTSGFGGRPASQQLSSRATERTIAPAPAPATSTVSTQADDTSDRSQSHGRYWRQP